MKVLKWEAGRQGGGYRKMLLMYGKSWDVYLIHYPTGAVLGLHRDPVPGHRHYRMNILLKKPKAGGRFRCYSKHGFTWWRVRIIRPDRRFHGMTKVREGSRWVLSIGWVIKEV